MAAAALLLGGPAGCEDPPFVIDPYPVAVDLTGGVPIVRGCAPEVATCATPFEPFVLVLDTGSPLTVLDPDLPPGAAPSRRVITLDVQAPGPMGMGFVPRARFFGVTALLAPIGSAGLEGDPTDPVPIRGVVGGDVLVQLAVRLDPAESRITFFPDIPGDAEAHGGACEAVLATPIAGGGSFELGGGVVDFTQTRVVIGACLNPDQPDPASTTDRPRGKGGDAQLVLSTGLEVTVLTRSAFVRAANQDCRPDEPPPDPPITSSDIDELPAAQVHLPSGPVPVRLGTLRCGLALAHDQARNRGPCGELWVARLMDLPTESAGCTFTEPVCPCGSSLRQCPAGPTLELGGAMTVAIVEDSHPFIQGLREELRQAGVAEIDGLLGMNALGRQITDIDYPNGRLIFGCRPGVPVEECVARPQIAELPAPDSVRHCLYQQAWL